MTESNDIDTAGVGPAPYRDEDLLRRLYHDEKMSIMAIGEEIDCSPSTVSKYMDKFGIEKRSVSDQISIGYGNGPTVVPFGTRKWGGEAWRLSSSEGGDTVYVHRLLAVAKYGFDAVKGMDVHHKSGITWDNRYDNIELMTIPEHRSHHKKFNGLERLRIAELYENGGVGSYKLARALDYDIDPQTIRYIHEEFYGGDTYV